MIEKVSQSVEVFSLNKNDDIKAAADAVLEGKITILRVGSVFSIVFSPYIEGLADKVGLIKGRSEGQLMSVVATYAQMKGIVDKQRVNEDFYRISEHFCGKVIVRIPVDKTLSLPFPYNAKDGSLQILNFKETHPLRGAFREELAAGGCDFISITSANLHGAPTIVDVEAAKLLAALFNMKASFFGVGDTRTVVTDIPADDGGYKGSFIILSFCNPDAIEVKRLANKTDREVTENCLNELFASIKTKTPLVYNLE